MYRAKSCPFLALFVYYVLWKERERKEAENRRVFPNLNSFISQLLSDAELFVERETKKMLRDIDQDL